MVFWFTFALPVPVFQAELWAEYNCKYVFTYKPYDECVKELNTQAQEAKQLEEKRKQEEYLKSPEYKQKLLEEKQKELEAKQAELEKKQKELEMKAEVKAEAKSVAKAPMSEEETKAYSELWDKAKVLESLVPIFEKKDKATQDRVRAVVEWFKLSNDNYTKNIGFYLSYLLR